MISNRFNHILGGTLSVFQKIWSAKPFVLRALVCWFVGIGVLLSERSDDFDTRFRLRGNTLKNSEIVLVLISEDEWLNLKGPRAQTLRPLKEIESFSDSFFSDAETWELVLGRLLRLNAKSIGVAFFLGDPWPIEAQNNRVLANPKIFWGAKLDSDGQLLRPRALSIDEKHLGLIDLKTDGDGYLRRFSTTMRPLPNLAYRLAHNAKLKLPTSEYALINFQGPVATFQTFTLTEFLFGNVPESAIRGKTIIVGARNLPSHSALTPEGPMSRAEVIANITHNINNGQWTKTLPLWSYAILLFALLILSIWVTTGYSQSIAIVILFCIWALLITISTWIFDTVFLWIPIIAPSVQLVITFVVFLSYQLIVNEKENWQLQQEKRYLEEIEEIKNNFLSLISHDLKTPIAKIQAVADRLLASFQDEKLNQDLKTVKSSSQDLYRYIQSILQVIRVESTDFHARKQPTDINEIIIKVIEDLMPLANEKKISLTQKLEPMFSIELDSTLIYEVILNFIENAIKYTPEGRSITVTSEEINDSVQVKVSDTGEGIPDDEISRVWNKFYRGKKHDLSTRGSGLGLYLSKYFIRLHGGEVFLSSQVGKGTDIGFRLPLSENEEETKG